MKSFEGSPARAIGMLALGANLQTPGFDVRRLMDNVIFVDNTRNLDTSVLPVPDMAVPE